MLKQLFAYNQPEDLCHAMLPSSHIYSLSQVDDKWLAEIEFDNLLHDGEGASEREAVLDALNGIISVLDVEGDADTLHCCPG